MTVNERLERLTPFAGLLGFVLLLVAAGIWLVTQQTNDRIFQVVLAFGAALTVFWVLGSLQDIRDTITGRGGRFGANTLVAIVAFIAILGFLNFLSQRYSTRWDLTANNQFAISDQTVKVLQNLKDPITVQAFYSQGDSRRQETQDLLKEYTAKTDKLRIDYIDPEEQPALARNLGIRVSGTIVFTTPSGKKTEVTSVTESAVTGALIQLQQTGQKKIYLTSANGEIDAASSDTAGFSTAKQQLERLNYVVENLNLITAPAVPADAAVVIIAGPRQGFTADQQRALETYLARGGRLMLLIDPQVQSNIASLGLESLMQTYGLRVPNGLVVDPTLSLRGDLGALIVQKYNFSPITREFTGNTPILLPGAGAVEKVENVPNTLRITSIAETSDQSWLETDVTNPRFDEGSDKRGPLSVAQTVERVQGLGTSEADRAADRLRIVVISDADFATNRFFNASPFLDGDFFLNSVNWLAEEEQLISIAPKPPDESRRIALTPIQQNLILFSSAIFLPLTVLSAGAIVWWQRR